MSQPGTTSPPALNIVNTRLRDAVEAFGDLARPFSIYVAAIGLVAGVFTLREDANRLAALGILAGVVTGVSFFRSQDKRAEITASVGQQK